MPPGTDDPRKLFILTTAGNYYSLDTPASLSTGRPLDNFLDDGNEVLLAVTRHADELHFSNKVHTESLILAICSDQNNYKKKQTSTVIERIHNINNIKA